MKLRNALLAAAALLLASVTTVHTEETGAHAQWSLYQPEQIEWREGDAEALPYENATFDVVLSQFGHIFAPRPDVATAEMLRVLRPGGTIAFATWPPELFMGRMFMLAARYAPPPPPGSAPPPLWGDPKIVTDLMRAAIGS